MSDVTFRTSNTANGTTTPATVSISPATGGNVVLLVIAVLGTSPTITTPAGFTQIQKVSGATLTVGLFVAFNLSGAQNPSSTLGGTVTGWIASIMDFTSFGTVGAIQGSNVINATGTSVTNIFSNVPSGQVNANTFFFYTIARATATFSPVNTGLNGGLPNWIVPVTSPQFNLWSPTISNIAGVQGLSDDNYWGSTLAQQINGFPSASGTLGSSVAWVAIGCWINTISTQPSSSEGCVISGNSGIINSGYAGMIGG